MMKRPVLILAGLFLPLCLWCQRTLLGNEACTALVQEGIGLVHLNKFNEALALFAKAEKEDPTASGPLSGRAVAFYEASLRVDTNLAADYRAKAAGFAAGALAREPRDPIALEVDRFLEEGPPKERYVPKAEAAELVKEGENLFNEKRYGEAKAKYLAACDLDPRYARAMVFAGDCDYVRKEYAQATALFRKAVQVDPLDEKGWRYLADALRVDGREAEAREALVSGISALPRYLPTWVNLADLPGPGPAWKSLGLKPKVKVTKDLKDGKCTVALDQDLLQGQNKDTADTAVWLAYGLSQAAKEAKQKPGVPLVSPFQAELEAWTTTLKIAEDLANGGKQLTDPVLIQMQAFRKAGDLVACLFLLAFRESYRDEFEAWKKAHPTGVRTFLETYRIKP